MKPTFAILDWEMMTIPVIVYAGPCPIPKEAIRTLKKRKAKSRYRGCIPVERIVKEIQERNSYRENDGWTADTGWFDKGNSILVWCSTYSDSILAHELIHVIHAAMKKTGIEDEEFEAYTMQWMFGDIRYKLTGIWDKGGEDFTKNKTHLPRHCGTRCGEEAL